jgi:cysteine desulfurase
MVDNIIYLDNNATTVVPPIAIKAMVTAINKGNPSASYKSAQNLNKLFFKFKQDIAERGGFELAENCTIKYITGCPPSVDYDRAYKLIFTSGASESNSTIIRSAVNAFIQEKGIMPHVIISNTEHKSMIALCNLLKRQRMIDLTILPVIYSDIGFGSIDPELLRSHIKPSTCIISIIAANNETGSITNISALAAVANEFSIPFHSDVVQIYGKSTFKPVDLGIDAFSISFHKLHGPKGIGLLGIRQRFIDGYNLNPIICGTQNCNFRGGTENITGIVGAYAGWKYNFKNRVEKNKKIIELKKSFIQSLAEKCAVNFISEYVDSINPTIVILSSSQLKYTLPNTILIAIKNDIFKNGKKYKFCSSIAKGELEKAGIIVSIGSACNTAMKKSSHVIEAFNIPHELRSGIIRISLGDETTAQDIKKTSAEILKLFSHPKCYIIDKN